MFSAIEIAKGNNTWKHNEFILLIKNEQLVNKILLISQYW